MNEKAAIMRGAAQNAPRVTPEAIEAYRWVMENMAATAEVRECWAIAAAIARLGIKL